MVTGECPHWVVRLSVPRRGGWRAWGAVSAQFERGLAGQESVVVIGPHVEGETRRGRDYVRVTVVMTVSFPEIPRNPRVFAGFRK